MSAAVNALFRSREQPGLVMNRYGIVLHGAQVMPDAVAWAVKREAIIAGWRLVAGPDVKDVGQTWGPGEAGPKSA